MYLLLLGSVQLASAQQPALRGAVVSAETGQPLGFSIVTLYPSVGRQFTDGDGTFVFAGTKPGIFLLSVRQIGYTPLDTQIVVAGDSTTTVRIALRHLAIELPPVTIAARQCTNPGRPDSSDAALATVFDQLQENARRFQLLADSYPFRYNLERALRTVTPRGDTGRARIDTIRLASTDIRPYAVGRVVEPAWGPWTGSELLVRTTELQEFANAEFISHHCFRLVGRDTIGGETLVRIDFEPSTLLGWADMAGAAYLDSLTYELRYTETALTHPERSELTDIRTMTARTRFRTISPGVPLEDSMIASTTYRFNRSVRIETHRTLDVRFRRQPR